VIWIFGWNVTCSGHKI